MLRLLTLGGLDLRAADERPCAALLRQPKRCATLAFMAVRGDGAFLSRNAVLPVFWEDADEGRARASLRTTLHALRAHLPPGAIETRGDEELRLDPAVVWCDAVTFRRAIAEERFDEALALYRGPLLDGFLPAGIPAFNDWLERERATLQRMAAGAARALYTRAAAADDDATAIAAARRWCELAPFEEPAVRALVAALADAGDRAGALDVYDGWTARLAAELGTTPSADTLALERHLRRAAPTPIQPSAPTRLDDAVAPADSPDAVPVVAAPVRGSRPALRRRVAAAAVVVAVMAVGASVLWLRGRAPGVVAGAAPRSVAVLPFSYGGDPAYDYLRHGLVDLLAARLNALTTAPVVDPRAVLGQYARRSDVTAMAPAEGRVLGERLGATHVVLGSLVEVNGRLSLSAALYETARRDANSVAQVALVGDVDDLFEMVDEAAYALMRTQLADAGRAGIAAAPALRTSSPDALRHFIDGELAFARGRYGAALEAYARATAADSTFARAYLRTTMAALWQDDWDTTQDALLRAQRHAVRLSRDEQTLLRAWSAHVRDAQPQVADSLYGAYLARHPEDAEAWLQLGEVRFHWGPTIGVSPRAAADAFERALALMPDHAGGLSHLVRLSARHAAPSVTDSLARALAALHPDARDVIEAGMIAALVARDEARADSIGRAAASLDNAALLGIAHAATAAAADFALVDRAMLALTPPSDYSAEFDARRVDLLVARGRLADADAALDRMKPDVAAERRALIAALPFLPVDTTRIHRARATLAAAPAAPLGDRAYYQVPEYLPGVSRTRSLLLSALLDLRVGDVASARARSDTLAGIGTGIDRAYGRRFASLVRALIHSRGGDHDAALRELGPPHIEPIGGYPRVSSYFLAFERWLRADAHVAAGRTARAIEWLETFPDNTAYDMAWSQAALRRLVELYGAVGREADARHAAARADIMAGAAAER